MYKIGHGLRDSNPCRRKKRGISPKLNAIIANVWGADQLKNREIIEKAMENLAGRFPAKTGGLESY